MQLGMVGLGRMGANSYYRDDIARARALASRGTPGREGEPTTAEQGYLHCGPPGAGHFVKMVHNGLEYGLMAAYAEGFNVLRHANIGNRAALADAETTPLRDLTASALHQSPDLEEFSGRVSNSGEGRWTVLAAVEGVPASVLSTALYGRFISRHEADHGDKLISAMRKEFGGHVERPAGE